MFSFVGMMFYRSMHNMIFLLLVENSQAHYILLCSYACKNMRVGVSYYTIQSSLVVVVVFNAGIIMRTRANFVNLDIMS